jgi:hypothetical protein
MLLPWARCEIFRHKWNAPMLAPRWTAPKLGPLLRREKDKRYYLRQFKKDGYVTGLARLALLLRARRIGEKEFVPGAADAASGGRKTLVVFSGMEGMFAPLLAHREMIRHRLLEILSPGVRRQFARQVTDFVIGVHVRRGDKPVLERGEPQAHPNQAMPDEWFIRCIQNLRRMLGFAAPVQIFSDGRRHELRALLALPNVKLAPENPAIIDMLMLARSRILVTSAHSTFSMWAAYLGQMPSLWYPGETPNLDPDKPYLECQTDLDGDFSNDFGAVIDSLNLALNP